MGTTENKLEFQASRPECEVFLEDFFISKHLITIQQYCLFLHYSGHHIPLSWITADWIIARKDHPVSCVSYHDASHYCDWLTSYLKKNNQIDDNCLIRLPTEAKWEKAARGSSDYLFPWGENLDPSKCNIKSSRIIDTTPVGKFSPSGDSPYGCSDMVGNVREWTISLWGNAANTPPHFSYPYDKSDGRESISPPDSYRRVVRGGGYYYDDECSTAIIRNRAFPHNIHNAGGYRVVKVIDGHLSKDAKS